MYDFYFRVYNKLKAALKVPFRLDGVDRVDDTPAHEALREAIVNALTNANWFDRRGVVCVWNDEAITIANPGDFRMPVEEARKPGSTDPRNEAMMRMFSMVEIGERAGSGMDKIFGGWEWAGYAEPSYEVAYGPDRTTLTLPLVSADSAGEVQSKAIEGNRRPSKMSEEALSEAERAIIEFLRAAGPSRTSEIAVGIGKSTARANVLLRRLAELGLVSVTGATSARRYRISD